MFSMANTLGVGKW